MGAEGPAAAEGRVCTRGPDWLALWVGGAFAVGAVWVVGLGADTRWERSRTDVDSASRSSAEAISLARTEEMSCSLVRSSLFSLARVASCVDTVSSWLVMATMPETVAHRMDRVDPSLAEMVWRA